MAAFDFSKTQTLEQSGLKVGGGSEKNHPRNKFVARLEEQLKFLDMPAEQRPKRGLLWKELSDPSKVVFTPKLGSRDVITYGKKDHVVDKADLTSVITTMIDHAKAGQHDEELTKTRSGMSNGRGKPAPAKKAAKAK